MIVIDNDNKPASALPPGVQDVLILRSDLLDLATFIVVQPGDLLSAIERAAGFPITAEHPPWEWVVDHGSVFEAPIITADDGSATVLVVPREFGIDRKLISLLSLHAVSEEAT